ncbi:peptidase associated/transthyretin-like domain-containing protein [Aestuariibaculum sediminum]|uniref:Carboxypeptidase-like regulatory domain-containing protein n=1 Tax=Aestuariibaculum sediminum TaxID=2770637 RepID=A0A8J6Q6H6_9FLAO|nr:carboxypeptidase-like regulatory domain-containing protein [Aestuariibaculum sediminum]MBD0830780.1 carboxypeptidase-like regulatory domain-containing protein [Aestuariibaculum sediminum]
MLKKYLSILCFTFLSFKLFAQAQLSATILDSLTLKPIPYTTISYNNISGVISNDEGFFLMNLKASPKSNDSIYIKCLGYKTKAIPALNFNKDSILLQEKSIELNEVLVSNKNYTAEEIIEKANNHLNDNYQPIISMSKLFYRSSLSNTILKNKVEVKESSIPELNQRFIDSIINAIPKQSDDYTEILGHLYRNENINEPYKLDITKAAHLLDENSDFDEEAIEKRMNDIIKNHVKRDSYFKIKSGIIGVKQDIDSSFFEPNKKLEKEKSEAFLEEQKKKAEERKKQFLKYRKRSIADLEQRSFIYKNSNLDFLEKQNRYNFEILDYLFLNDSFVYKIVFTPKRKADYQGVLYINTDDFAIIRVDYESVNPLKKFSLFGISYMYTKQKGTLIYNKIQESNVYTLKYAEDESTHKIGFDRPLKIIEKNKHTKGRRKQNELSTDIHFIFSTKEKEELAVFENKIINESSFNAFYEKANVTPTQLKAYDPDFWKGYNVIEPNEAIKNFKSIEAATD